MISVIIPVFNTEEYITRCVNSLINQTYSDLQIILINDGSTDDSLMVIHALAAKDDRIICLDRVHAGVSAARNAGLEVASGEYVSFIDSDDWLDTNCYEVLIDIAKDEDADAVFFDWTEEYSDGTSNAFGHDGSFYKRLEGDEVCAEYLKNRYSMHISSSLLKRSIIEGIKFEIGRKAGEDMLFGFYAGANATLAILTNYGFYHRYNRVGSLSNTGDMYNRNKLGVATSTDDVLIFVKEHKMQLLNQAYSYSFNFYLYVINFLIYYKMWNIEQKDYLFCRNRLKELWGEMRTPLKILPLSRSVPYLICRINPWIYYLFTVVYYNTIRINSNRNGKRGMVTNDEK